MFEEDTIAAISTPMGSGGIGIIRVSGPEAFAKAKKLFRASLSASEAESSEVFDSLESHTLKHGYAVKPASGEILDECLFGKMKAPHTYTCEDVVEINCHGGIAVMKSILRELFSLGIRPAKPGEFTKRAFLNGRIDLTEAEGVMDTINAATEKSRKAATLQLSGRFAKELSDMRTSLTEAIGEIEVALAYPEYEMDVPAFEHTKETLRGIINKLDELSLSYGRGKLLRDGLNVVIAGKPNAGKSSLLNRLTGYERAIVTDIPGTTRDVIEEFTEIDGYPVIFTDTAGLRESEDMIEMMGVDRAKEKIAKADLVFFVADPFEEEFGMPEKSDAVVVINKTDKASETQIERCREYFKDFETVEISAVTGEGTEKLIEKIKEKFESGRGGDTNEMLLTNERHKELIDKSREALARGIEACESGMPLDCITYDMWQSAGCLGEIVGESVTEEVIDSIFDRFCLGK